MIIIKDKMTMLRYIFITIFFCNSVYAITMDDAIQSVYQNKSTPETQIQDYTHRVNRINAIEISQQALPNVYLYYNYSKPSAPRFDGQSAGANGTLFGRFVTGIRQENYGIAGEYNVLALPQLLMKIQSTHYATKASLLNSQNKKSEFYYSLATTYVALYRAQNKLVLQTKVFETAQSRYNEMQKYFSYGRTTKKDLLLAESSFLTSQTALESSKNDLIVAEKRYLDKFSALHTDLVIPDLSIESIAKNLDELKKLVETNNSDLQSKKYAAKGYGVESYVSAIGILPTVTVGYREQYSNMDPLLSIPNYTQGTFYINARMDLLNMAKYLDTFKNRSAKNQKIAESKVAKKNYVTEAEGLWYDVKNQDNLISVLQKVVSNSKEVHAITKREVEYGSKSFTDELEAKEGYIKSEIDLLEARLKKN